MSKYLCVTCGMTFNRKKHKLDHQFYFEDHIIVGRTLKGKIIDFLLNIDWRIIFKIIAVTLIAETFIHHFKISFSNLESLFIGLGLGFLII